MEDLDEGVGGGVGTPGREDRCISRKGLAAKPARRDKCMVRARGCWDTQRA